LHDGWILRFANGYSRRNNSVNAFYPGFWPAETKIKHCEEIFSARQMIPTFRMTPFVDPFNLDTLLEAAGYQVVSPTSVQVVDLSMLQRPAGRFEPTWWDFPDDRWVDAYVRINRVSPEKHRALNEILTHIPADTCYLALQVQQRTVACGLGVIDPPFLGLFDIVTDPAYRRQGIGRELVLWLARRARRRAAEIAYLQVVADNVPALRLYESLGFREIYQYWYRVKAIKESG
jgi:ribosomal protein S18 acetylase RimI-like enzyme